MVVLHRDLRPSNVLISGEYWSDVKKEQINLLDFDLSWYKGASGSEFYMNAAQALGYLAPEQLNVRSNYSTRTALVDVYGLGMLLYFILSAEIPLASASTRNDWLERAQVAARRAFNSHWNSTVHRALRLIVSSTDEIQPRRPSLQEFIDEIDVLVGIHEGLYPLDPQSILEELVVRVLGQDAVADHRGMSDRFEATTSSGVYFKAQTNRDTFSFAIEYTVSENSNRQGRGKYLSQSMDKAKAALRGIAAIDERRSGTQLGRNLLYFSTGIPNGIAGVNRLSAAVGTAMAEIPVRA